MLGCELLTVCVKVSAVTQVSLPSFPIFNRLLQSVMHTHTHTHNTCSVILVRTTYRPPLFYIRLMICPNSTPNPKHHPHKNMIQLFMILTRDVWLTSSTCFTILVRTCFNREDILDLTTWTKLLKFFGQIKTTSCNLSFHLFSAAQQKCWYFSEAPSESLYSLIHSHIHTMLFEQLCL